MTEWQIGGLFLLGVAQGLAIGWFCWRLPMLHAEQRGRELEEDGLCVRGNNVRKCLAIDEAGRKAMQDMRR